MAVNSVSSLPRRNTGAGGSPAAEKTTLGRTLLRLIAPIGGQVLFEGQDVSAISGRQLQQLRREMQIIFKTPLAPRPA